MSTQRFVAMVYLVDDAVGDARQDVVGHVEPVRGHEVRRLHRSDSDDLLVRPAVTHDTHALAVQQDAASLRSTNTIPQGDGQNTHGSDENSK